MVQDETASEPDDPSGSPIPRLVLENSAGMGDGIGATLEDLSDILDGAATSGLAIDRLGVCLDTAHLWGAGYDVSNDDGVEQLVGRIDDLVGRENVVMLHLNDSRTLLGSHMDRHEHIAAGHLGADGLRGLLTHPWLATLPTYLETPGMDVGYDKVNLDRARQLVDGDSRPCCPPRLSRCADRGQEPLRRRLNGPLTHQVEPRAVPRAYIEQQSRTGLCRCRPFKRPKFEGEAVTRRAGEVSIQ